MADALILENPTNSHGRLSSEVAPVTQDRCDLDEGKDDAIGKCYAFVAIMRG